MEAEAIRRAFSKSISRSEYWEVNAALDSLLAYIKQLEKRVKDAEGLLADISDDDDEERRLRLAAEAQVKQLEGERDALHNEVDCRIEHGAESGGHLEYVRDCLAAARTEERTDA